nr:septum formation initiator family protein [Nesterenkonia sp. Act20]
MIVLSLVVLVVISFLVPTVNSFFQQRSEMMELEAQIAAEQQEQAELQSELLRWEDPDFVRQQARERINLVMPGERRYQVMGSAEDGEQEVEELDSTEVRSDLPWAEALWDSLVRSAAE